MAEYHVENFGCRASRADGEAIASGLRTAGLLAASKPDAADVIVLNTCSVTAEAEKSARAYLRRARRANPAVRVVVTGCFAQRAPEEAAALSGVDAVVGNSHKAQVVDVALKLAVEMRRPLEVLSPDSLTRTSCRLNPVAATISHDPLFAHSELSVLPFASDAQQTRPNLKVQDGCGNRCSFCIIPVTRGPSRSVALAECLRAVGQFVEAGGQELVLSGINLGRWGRDLSPSARLEELVAAILEQTELPRLRISSVEPMDWSAELIALLRQFGRNPASAGPRLARHAHLPLQSGSDAILRAMHRRYRPWHYAAKVEEIRAAAPHAAIGADVMIGFPGESDVLFRETFDFIDKLPLTYLHVFPFSARPGTTAFRLHESAGVSAEAVRERKVALRNLIHAKNQAFRQQFLHAELSVVTLLGGSGTQTEALSDNFLKVSLQSDFPANQLLRVQVAELSTDGLRGTVVRHPRGIE